MIKQLKVEQIINKKNDFKRMKRYLYFVKKKYNFTRQRKLFSITRKVYNNKIIKRNKI